MYEGGTWVARDADPNSRHELARGKRVDFGDRVYVTATADGSGARLRAVPSGSALSVYKDREYASGIPVVQVDNVAGNGGTGGFEFGL